MGFIGENKKNIYNISYLLFLNLGIIGIILIALDFFKLINLEFIVSDTLLFSIIIFSLLISLISKYNLDIINNNHNSFLESIFHSSQYLFLSILIILALNQFFRLDFLTQRNTHIIILGIAFGFLAFYRNKDRVEREIEDEKRSEEEKERHRLHEFSWKFPTLNKIWGLRSIVRLMYKEGWGYSLALIGIIILNFYLVFSQWHLIKGLWIDEWISNKTAEVYFSGTFPYFPSGNPISSGYVYFFLLGLFNNLFGFFLHSGRILNLFFFLSFAPIFYLLVKKMFESKKIALISLFIISISSFTIYMINEIRGYVFSLNLSYLIILVLISNIKKFFKFLLIILLSIILLDNHITNIYFLLILLMIIFLEIIFDKDKRKYILLFLGIGFLLFVLALLAYKGNPIEAISFYLRTFAGDLPGWAGYKESFFYPITYLFNNIGNAILILIGLFGYSAFAFKNKRIIYPLIFLIIFIIPLCFSGIPSGFRYFFVIVPLFSLILGIGINHFLKLFDKKTRILLILLLVAMAIFISIGTIQKDVPWAKTLNFEKTSYSITPYIKSETIVITNYMGVQFDEYLPRIDYILYDNQDFFYYENQARFGKRNIFGFKSNGETGKHSILNVSYIDMDNLGTLAKINEKDIVILIRPWPLDIDEETYNEILSLGFEDKSEIASPFRLFILNKPNS